MRPIVKIRYFCYLTILLFGIFLNFWIYHGIEVSKYYLKTVQSLVEMHKRHVLRNETIIISLTTTPYRIDKLKPVLEKLFLQNVKISKIYLNVPYVFKRDNVTYVIPKWLNEESRVTILRSNDFGPATKLLGTLEKAQLPGNSILITVDDDMSYPPNLVLHLAYAAKKHPDSVITLFGGDLAYDADGKMKTRGNGLHLNFTANALVATILGYAGVAYRPEFFDDKIFAVEDAPKECFMHDDFYISFHLARRNIPRRNIDSVYVSEEQIQAFDYISLQPQALLNLTPNRAKLNIACLAYLSNIYPNVNF